MLTNNALQANIEYQYTYTISMRILFCGGGTAGHVTPNIALIELLHDQHECQYMGTDGMEKTLVSPLIDSGALSMYHTIPAVKLARKLSLSHLTIPIRLAKAVSQATHTISQILPDVIFAKGGYVSLPAVIAGHKLHIPTIVHESDMSLGLANKISRFYATRMLSTFDNTKHCQGVGAILRPSLYSGDRQRGLDTMGYSGNKPILLVMGGSLGASQLNEIICQCTQLQQCMDIFVITGKGKSVDCHLHQRQYVTNMADIYACTTMAITRGGANSLIELTTLGIPHVSIPLIKLSRGEQIENCRCFSLHGCGTMLLDNITPTTLTDSVMNIYANLSHYKANCMATKLDGTATVANIITSYNKH